MYHVKKAAGLLGHRRRCGLLEKACLAVLALCLLCPAGKAQYGGGTGQPDDPYLIYTAAHMNEIGATRNDWDKHFRLMADIDLGSYTGKSFNIIGAGKGNPFSGVFHGNGKRITNFRYTSQNQSDVGLFGYVKGAGTEIMNLGLVDPYVRAGSNVGSLVGYVEEGVFTNCYVQGASVSGKEAIGGLIGYLKAGRIMSCSVKGGHVSGDEDVGGLAGYSRARIEDCYSTCSVSAIEKVGGLIGTNSVETIVSSWTTGRVSGEENDVGGLIGVNSGSVTNCSATGAVLGDRDVGGLVGDNRSPIAGSFSTGDVSGQYSVGGLVGGNADGAISNSYAGGTVVGDHSVGGLTGTNRWPGRITYSYSRGHVTGTDNVGGLVGSNLEGFVSTSFWDVQASGRSQMCGRENLGIGCNDDNGMTTSEMKRESTFVDAGWDFVDETVNGLEDVWSICERLDYPALARQAILGDFDGNNRVDAVDFAFFAERWLSADAGFFWCRGADLTGDGKVGIGDLRLLAANWLDQGVPVSSRKTLLTVDDFESYNDLGSGDPESNRIFDAWLDGYYNPATNGAIVGHKMPPFAERQIVHGGRQSMPYYYDTLFKFAKAQLTLDPAQNWAAVGGERLSLWLRGDSSNAPVPMSVVLNDSSTAYHDNPDAAQTETWTEWILDLEAFAGVDLASIESIAICFGDPGGTRPGGSGTVYFDDIRLCGPG